MSYDQWKTASPYDDEPDPIDDGEKWLKRHEQIDRMGVDAFYPHGQEMFDAYHIIKGLLDYIGENI
jgi:hypothetical protein